MKMNHCLKIIAGEETAKHVYLSIHAYRALV